MALHATDRRGTRFQTLLLGAATGLVGNRLRLHTVPAFISVVGGLMMFGSAGLILGPVTLTVTSVLLDVWRQRAVTASGGATQPGRPADWVLGLVRAPGKTGPCFEPEEGLGGPCEGMEKPTAGTG